MLHTIDHGLTETMFSLSPSNQFMYEPEMLESTSCGQTQTFTGPPVTEVKLEKGYRQQEGIINPSVEGMTFQDCIDQPDTLYGLPSTEFLTFQDPFDLDTSFDPTIGGLGFNDSEKTKEAFGTPKKGVDFEEYSKSDEVFDTSLERIAFDDSINRENNFGDLDANRQLDLFVPPVTDTGVFDIDGIGNDWFELDKDICEISKDDGILQDTIFGGGPTLTQLNSKDLDSTFLDEFNVLDDLYASSETLISTGTAAQPYSSMTTAPATAVASKFQPVQGTTMSPKFTTCTITSFVTSVSTSLPTQPPYPVYLTNELPLVAIQQDTNSSSSCGGSYLMRGIQHLKQEPAASRHNVTELMLRRMATSATYPSSCFLPVLSDGTRTVGLVQTMVVPGTTVSVMVTDSAPDQVSSMVTENRESSDASLDNKWKEIEQLIQCSENREPAPASSSDVNQYETVTMMESKGEN